MFFSLFRLFLWQRRECCRLAVKRGGYSVGADIINLRPDIKRNS